MRPAQTIPAEDRSSWRAWHRAGRRERMGLPTGPEVRIGVSPRCEGAVRVGPDGSTPKATNILGCNLPTG